jgi:PilZ domain
MSYAQDLARELMEMQVFDQWRRDQLVTTDGASGKTPLRLLRTLQREVVRVAGTTAVAASVANAHSKGWIPGPDASVVETFKPVYSKAFKRAIEELSPHVACFDLVGLWLELEARVDFACRAGRVLNQSIGSPMIDADAVADSWRRVASATIRLHDALGEQIRRATSEQRDEPDRPPVMEALAQAANGNAPCIDADGLLSVDGWAERRKRPRTELHLPAKIRAGVVSYPATIENVSSGGIGLLVPAQLAPGTPVDISLPDRRNLHGLVRWSRDDRIGIALKTPLAPSDPLMREAARVR